MTVLARSIRQWGAELGFQGIGIADVELNSAAARLAEWLARGWHGEMDYMVRHAALRADPRRLMPEALRVISCRMNYSAALADESLVPADGARACVARYARGRDYHKVLRHRLQQLCERIEAEVGSFAHRVCTDSAPVMEVELAARAGIGWRGKNTLLLARDSGSYFFLGEVLVGLPLPVDAPVTEHCGSCAACLAACPTGAIRAPYQLDARRCISYLTIELKGAIPEDLRPLVGNRVYGCDDCQSACPWNSFARISSEPDFGVRHGLDRATLVELFAWSESEFEARLRGSAIRRVGYARWLRNLAVGLGNAPSTPGVVQALRARADHPSPLVREHVAWARSRHE